MLLASGALAAAPARDGLGGPGVGQVFSGHNGMAIDGWAWGGGGLWSHTQTERGVTTVSDECCFALFSRGDAYLVLKTTAVARGPRGGVESERVVDRHYIRRQAGEREMLCFPLGVMAVLSLVEPKTRHVRSVMVGEEGAFVFEWIDRTRSCDSGER